MVKLNTVRAANTATFDNKPFVAVFVGGTSGLGEYTLRALVNTRSDEGKGLRLYIVGRNSNSAQAIIAECQHACPDASLEFVQAKDLALLKDVDGACAQIKQLEESKASNGDVARVDLLVMSQANSVFAERKRTSEGLDTTMSLMYYSRMRFIVQLQPLLVKASDTARIVSIFAAGTEGTLFTDDLSLRKAEHGGYFNARSHIVYMKTFFMERLAHEHPGKLSLVHAFPGLIETPAFQDPVIPFWFRALWWLLTPAVKLYALSPSEVGARLLFLGTPRFPSQPKSSISDNERDTTNVAIGTDGKFGSGAYRVGQNGEALPIPKAYQSLPARREEVAVMLCDHTIRAFETIEAGNVFTD